MTTKKEQQYDLAYYIKTYGIQVLILAISVITAYYVGSLSAQVKFYQEKLASAQPSANQQKQAANNPSAPTVTGDVDKPTENDKITGNKNAKFALVEYSDYDCPFCSKFHETAKTFVDQNKDQVMWIYRHFPLPQLHPDAAKKAEAAECVKQIGGNDAFWKFSDALFAEKTSVDSLAKLASDKAGINSDQFTKCLDSGQGKAGVEADTNSGKKAGVSGTPGNYLLNIATGEAMALRGAVPLDTLNTTLKMMSSAK